MEIFDATKLIEEMIEDRLELNTLRMVLGMLMVVSESLNLHPAAADLQKALSLNVSSAKDRIHAVSEKMDAKAEEFKKAQELLLSGPATTLQ